MVDSLKAFPIDVANLSAEDLHYFSATEAGRTAPAIPAAFVSGNVRLNAGAAAPPRHVVRSVEARTARGSKPLRIGLTGLTDPAKLPMGVAASVEDPLVAARAVVQALRGQCDLLVVLADLSQPQAADLARRVEGIDVVVYGEKNAFPGPPEQVNDTVLFSAADQGRYLGELRVYTDPSGEVVRYKTRYIGLDPGIPDEAGMAALVDSTRQAVGAFHRRRAAAPLATPVRPVYAGSARCADCHTAAHAVWARSAHARAMDILKAKGQEFNPQCVRCHSTGFGVEGGFLNLTQTPGLANIHCESCHGPALAHRDDPSRPLPVKAGRASCLPCHTSVDSPHFDFAKAWAQIKH